MKPVEIQNLDQHLKPLQVDGVSTGIEISTEALRFTGGTLEVENVISKNTQHEGDLTVNGDMYLNDTNGGTLYLTGGQKIDSKTTDYTLRVSTQALFLTSSTDFTDVDSKILVSSTDGYDAQITFMEGAGIRWSIGNDGANATSTLSFSTDAVLGTNEQMSLTSAGLLTVAGDIVAGDDIAVAATGKLYLDGIGGNTYIDEAADDILRCTVGNKRMLVLDETNDRITLESGKLVYELAGGDEWSVADSAWAGTIIGYRMIGEDGGIASYALTTSLAVPDSDMTVRFEAPPSGAVEVMVQVMQDGGSGRTVLFGLSDNATFNSLGNSYNQISSVNDETDAGVVQHFWTVTGLTAGDTYNYWFGAAMASGAGNLFWGGTTSGRYCDFIMKVTALPAATSDFAEYD